MTLSDSSHSSEGVGTVRSLEPIVVRSKFLFEGDRKFFMKGVTYGPFQPDGDPSAQDKEGFFVGTPEKVRKDFGLIREMGANLLLSLIHI